MLVPPKKQRDRRLLTALVPGIHFPARKRLGKGFDF
jgi:hypothetical protein